MIGREFIVGGIRNSQQVETVFFSPFVFRKVPAMGVLIAIGISELAAVFEVLLSVEFDEGVFVRQVEIKVEVGVCLGVYAVGVSPVGIVGDVEFVEDGGDEGFAGGYCNAAAMMKVLWRSKVVGGFYDGISAFADTFPQMTRAFFTFSEASYCG